MTQKVKEYCISSSEGILSFRPLCHCFQATEGYPSSVTLPLPFFPEECPPNPSITAHFCIRVLDEDVSCQILTFIVVAFLHLKHRRQFSLSHVPHRSITLSHQLPPQPSADEKLMTMFTRVRSSPQGFRMIIFRDENVSIRHLSAGLPAIIKQLMLTWMVGDIV